jgi:hypothetical protein
VGSLLCKKLRDKLRSFVLPPQDCNRIVLIYTEMYDVGRKSL